MLGNILDGISAPARTGRDSTILIDFRELVQDIVPALLHVDEWFATPVLPDGIGELYGEVRSTREQTNGRGVLCPKVVEPVGLMAIVK